MGEVAYFGDVGMQPGAELVTDKNGLVTGQVTFKCLPGAWSEVPRLGAVHPLAAFCHMERRGVRMTQGFWEVTCSYAGMEPPDEGDDSTPQYSLSPGVGNERIELHKKFVTHIAGKASAPLNGAKFVDEHGIKTSKDDGAVFDRFAIESPWAGTEEYLTPNNTVWTKSWTSRAKPGGGDGMTIVATPPGSPPTPAGHNWLAYPVACTQRGEVWECNQQWLLSGPRGWNTVIYD